MTKPTILTDEQMRPGQEVEQHLRKHGHLPETGCCDPTPMTKIPSVEERVEEIKSELQNDSFRGCILGILQDFASIQEPTNKHYLEAATRVSNAALYYAKIDGGKVMFNTIEEALTPPTK